MPELDRDAILKQMGIMQWVLRDAKGDESVVQDKTAQSVQAMSDKPAAEEPPAQSASVVEELNQPGPAAEPVRSAQVPESTAQNLDALRNEVAACEACALAQTRTQTVFGAGPDQADWLFIGEAPGQQEDRQGQPFVGRAGGLLTQMVNALALSREQVYVANMLKCHPPDNRDPLPGELFACAPFLRKQIELIQPKVLVALGQISAQALLKSDQPLETLRGQVYQYGANNIPLIVTYHPAYLLRQPDDKGKVWADLLLAHRQIPV